MKVGFGYAIVCIQLIFMQYFHQSYAISLYVSKSGSDTKTCGTINTPCFTLSYAMEKSDEHDNILISAKKHLEIFEICQQRNSSLLVDQSISIGGTNLKPLLSCTTTDYYAFTIKEKQDKNISLTFTNIAFTNNNLEEKICSSNPYGMVRLTNANIFIDDCTFFTVCTAIEFIPSESKSKSFVSIIGSDFENICRVIKADFINHLDLYVIESKIKGTTRTKGYSHAITVKSYKKFTLSMVDCVVSQYNEGVSITVKEYHSIEIKKCIFTNNEGQSIIITYLENSDIYLSYTSISNVQFIKNAGMFASSIHLVSKGKERKEIHIDQCIFYDNLSQTFFGAVYADGVNVNIFKCDFLNNVAGEHHGAIQGFGGAIYVESNTKVLTESTHFINNTSSGFGGTVFSRGTFTCINCSFTGASKVAIRPLLGDIIYATEGLTLINTSWETTISHEGQKSLIWHPGSPTLESWQIVISGVFKATCPVGHNISYSGIERQYTTLTKRVVMSCKSCPKNQYSLDSGSVYIHQKEGMVLEQRIETSICYNCKYGGVCARGSIKPQANYFGYKRLTSDDELKFIPCPIGYCCKGDSCIRYNSCQKKRTGLLCGACKNGTSENLINSDCATKEECVHQWIWIILIPIGVFYILGFMYLDKISTFISNQLIWWERKIHHHDDLEDYEFVDYGMFSSRDPFETKPVSRENTVTTTTTANTSADNVTTTTTTTTTPTPTVNTIRESGNDGQNQKKIYKKREERPDDILSVQEETPQQKHKIFHPKPGQKERGPDAFTDLLTISFYFYQMFILIRMQESIVLDYTFRCLRSVYSSFFTLSIQGNSPLLVCPIFGLTAVTKLLIVRSFSLFVLALLLCFHSVVYVVQFLLLQDPRRQKALIIFSVRLKVATIQILLISYASLSETAVTLVNCITMYDKEVLFVDGNIICYTKWQIAIFIFVVGWIVPFPFVMATSMIHLKREVITYHQFVIAWAFPLFYLLLIATSYTKLLKPRQDEVQRKRNLSVTVSEFSIIAEEKLSIDEILFRMECPYKGNKNHLEYELNLEYENNDHFEPVVWQGTLIGRRLVLIMVLTFIKAPVSRLYCALFICIIYLVHHLYHRPYLIGITNMFETITSIVLVMFCSMNLFFAYSYVSDLPPEKADENLTLIFRWTEATIIVIVPTIIGIVLTLLLFTRVIILVGSTIVVSCNFFRRVCCISS